MKIFNWVHRKFHKNVDDYFVCPKKEDGDLATEVKKLQSVTNETDRETLLDHVTLVDVLDGWKDGILTIGTFGFDPLKKDEYFINFAEEERNEADEKEEAKECSMRDEGENPNPTVLRAFKQEFQKVIYLDVDTCISKPDDFIRTVDDAPLLRFIESPQIRCDDVWIEKKKRTTLADLMSAESIEVAGKSDPDEESQGSGKKPGSRTKNGLSFAKKIMPGKGEDSRPIKKIHRMVTKMLKKKIHPAHEGRINRNEGSTTVDSRSKMMNVKGAMREGCQHESGTDDGMVESVSLL